MHTLNMSVTKNVKIINFTKTIILTEVNIYQNNNNFRIVILD